ncbi:glycine cleavage system aminomethyltransferase GcvT [Halobacterium salinarum]|uniref:Probable aminomethyltransferase n=5 Tax=Halobacterium salinarum TaxID=2242 RepID=GCST_HALSA|nr:glycine cleavage system aminomethyltransferase GcvT [Halobacterium salinarum]B0R5Y8.1 RecName: Full=Probable aminomethyltransferase; AltName: Full=Glycine cleavage system T protein [Halobacterium salinarum R1]Q9HPJ7.2 RecName: Full=Probable aminomethyltransferase; AltName: Full=Glycine cleavage system T protein [Halobacterium salinarum NRC-1]MBB6088877.1 aminomethyltransferase [Halobacterium salinarum]MDL0121071.1 glycine cleavage system aminomethyltransferase GcvT [Halobacterium salinarum]
MGLRTSPLHGRHEDRGASFTEFGGWNMPVDFDGIQAEHAAVREAAGIFDVSHMGEIEVSGPDAERLMQRLTTNDVSRLDPGDAQYAAITDDDGIMIDDTVVYRTPADWPGAFLFVPNAGHDAAAFDRWTDHRDAHDLDASVDNVTTDYGMVAVQGPDAPDLVAARAGDGVHDLGRFEAATVGVAGVECLVANTGYTGEAGVEIVFPADGAGAVWDAIANDCQPCGLGARDTLRMEHGFLLSGQDFDPEENPRTPFEAGIGFAVAPESGFVGRDALADTDSPEQQFVGLTLDERGVPRHGYAVTTPAGDEIGTVTSGTMSPTLGEPIGLGYVDSAHAADGTTVAVRIRGTDKQATITTPPFLDQ